jgi:carbonic anhydrase
LQTVLVLSVGLLATYAAASKWLGSACVAIADRATAAEEAQSLSSEQAWQRLKVGNNRFAEGRLESPDLGAGRRAYLAKGQKPFAVVLTCADSRVTPEFIFNQGLGDLFVLRVAGNIADQFELESIEYAVEHLHMPLVVILGHDDCGAVKAALGGERPPGNLGKLLAEIDIGKDLPAGKDAALEAAIRNNVHRQTRLLTERSDVIREHVARKEVRIVSGIYQLVTGKVKWFQEK